MRYLLTVVCAALVWVAVPAKSEAWGYYRGGYNPYLAYRYNPYAYSMPPMYSSAAYVGPYGYRSFYNVGAYPTYYGYNTVYSYGAWQQPYVAGPFHSIYFNPYANTYQYGTGVLNTPTYSYFYGY